MQEKEALKSSVLGATLLIAGCSIGVGMLGIPVLSTVTGFYPSIAVFLISWAFMLCTGLLLLEVNLRFPGKVSLISMAKETIGPIGQLIIWITFLFLFYSLLVAYLSGGGGLITDFLNQSLNKEFSNYTGIFLLSSLLLFTLYKGISSIDYFNRLFMIGLILAYAALVFLGFPHINFESLQHQEWKLTPVLLPVLIVSFGFHNMIPSLTSYLNHDAKKLRQAIVCGSLLSLTIYLIWQLVIMGLISSDQNLQELLDRGQMATQMLSQKTSYKYVSLIANLFAFFAILTSIVAVSISFLDFLADGLQTKKETKGVKILLCCLVLIPPLFFTAINPNIFLVSLNYAGGIGAVILFGILPAVMCWSSRYSKKIPGKILVPGKKPLLIAIILFSTGIIFMQIIQKIYRYQGIL